MSTRSVLFLLATTALLTPLAVMPAASEEAPAPDLAVSLRVGRVLVPPTFSLTITVCNEGDAAGGAGAPLTWTARPLPGLLLDATGPGDVRVVEVRPLHKNLAPGECVPVATTWGQAWNIGEYEFGGYVAIEDADAGNNARLAQAANPPNTAGSGLGGADL